MLKTRKSMGKIVVMFCIAAITAFAGIANAHNGGSGGERCDKQQHNGRWDNKHGDKQRHHDFKKLAKKLGLTDDQKTKAKAIFEGNKAVVKPIFTSLRAERKNLQTLIHADTVDEAAIRAETAKIAGIQADLNVNRAKVGAQFRAILKPAQLATLKTLHQEREKRDEATTAPAK